MIISKYFIIISKFNNSLVKLLLYVLLINKQNELINAISYDKFFTSL